MKRLCCDRVCGREELESKSSVITRGVTLIREIKTGCTTRKGGRVFVQPCMRTLSEWRSWLGESHARKGGMRVSVGLFFGKWSDHSLRVTQSHSHSDYVDSERDIDIDREHETATLTILCFIPFFSRNLTTHATSRYATSQHYHHHSATHTSVTHRTAQGCRLSPN